MGEPRDPEAWDSAGCLEDEPLAIPKALWECGGECRSHQRRRFVSQSFDGAAGMGMMLLKAGNMGNPITCWVKEGCDIIQRSKSFFGARMVGY